MTALRISDIELGDYVGVSGLGIVGNLFLGTPRSAYESDVTPFMRAVHDWNTNITVKGAHIVSFPFVPERWSKHNDGVTSAQVGAVANPHQTSKQHTIKNDPLF